LALAPQHSKRNSNLKNLDNKVQDLPKKMIKESKLKSDGRTIIFYTFTRAEAAQNNRKNSAAFATDNPALKDASGPAQDSTADPVEER
jgi:hypothetical protein